MGNYVDENLVSGETVLYRTRLHWIVVVAPTILGVLFGFIALILLSADSGGAALLLLLFAALIVAVPFWSRATTEMAVTNKRLIFKVGLLTRKTIELLLTKVESVGVDQGILGRILDYGTIRVRGTGGTLEPFKSVAFPLEFRRQVQEQVERSHQGVAAASAS